jgi:NADH-quinone oxidoreductase subunit G
MPIFHLDDEPIEFKPGENILAALLRAGKYVPHYCFHPALKVTAQCRQCLVDIVDMGNGRPMPKLQASCSTPAAEKMRVSSKNAKVQEAQRQINEFLLVNHPLDCPICDQAGECELQNIAHGFGSGHSEMEYEKRVYGWRDVGTFIALERNRCIHCSRCERFTRDVTGTHDFGVYLRSHELTFDTFEDHQIADKFQGNLADLCPVGCIMNRDWRFKKRAWKLKRTDSVCTSCSTGCNVTLDHHQNVIYRLKPRENPEVNRWWMCDEGRVGFHPLNERKGRPLEPMARVKGQLKCVAWSAIYEAIAARLKEIGASGDQVVGLADTSATNEELFLFRSLLQQGFGSAAALFPYTAGKQQEQPPANLADPFIYTLVTTDKSPNTAGALALGLTPDGGGALARRALTKPVKVVIVLGAPFAGDAALLQAAGKAELIVQIAHAESPWNARADVLLPGLTSAEKWGSFTNKAGRVQRIQPAITPPPLARAEFRILAELLRALGKEIAFAGAPEVFGALAGQESAFKGLAWEQLGSRGAPLASKPPRPAGG